MATYNVAAPTGTASTDTANIQQALTNAIGNPGSTVILAAGTYLINAKLSIGSSTEFKGVSGSIIKVANNALGTTNSNCICVDGQYMIHVNTGYAHDISIHDFEFDGNRVNQSATLGNAATSSHANTNSYGNGIERFIGFTGSSGGPYVTNISVYNMYLHDGLCEGFYCRYGQNIKVYNNRMVNLQHDAIYTTALSGSGNEFHHNTIEGITDGCIRCDSCQNVNIYNNTISPYEGSNNGPAPKHGENGLQIADNGNYTQLTNNIQIYNNTFTDISLTGIWILDAKGTAGLTNQTVHIYNNEFNNCGKHGNSGVDRGGAITYEPWGNGVTIEYNSFNGSHPCAILILSAISGTSTFTAKINNNNFLNTAGKGSSGSTVSTSAVGYAIYNKVNTKVSANITGNFFSGNLTGKCYLCSSLNESSVANGAMPGTETPPPTPPPDDGGGTVIVIPVVPGIPGVSNRYIPHSRQVRELLSDYFFSDYKTVHNKVNGRLNTAYVNKCPILWYGVNFGTSRTIAQNKVPSTDGWNIGDFGFEGSTVTIDCLALSNEDKWREMAAWNARTPAILEIGGVYDGWFLSGIPTKFSSSLSLPEDVPEGMVPYSVDFTVDKPIFQSTVERIRTRRITQNLQQWSSADAITGNELKNPSFDSWTTGTANVAPDWWTLETVGQSMGEIVSQENAFSLLITGDGASANVGSIVQSVSCEAGVYYILSGYGAAIGNNQGKLVIEVYADGMVKESIMWNTPSPTTGTYLVKTSNGYQLVTSNLYNVVIPSEDGDIIFTRNQALVKFDIIPGNAVVRIHVQDTANAGSKFYCDNVFFGKLSDVELQINGNEIVTFGNEDVIPDIEVAATKLTTTSGGTTQDIPGTQVIVANVNGTYSGINGNGATVYTTAVTAYSNPASLQVTTVLPALPNGGKYLIQNVSCQLATANSSYAGWCEVLLTSASLGTDVQLAEWSSTSLNSDAYTAVDTDVANRISTNEPVTFKFKIRATNASYPVYAQMFAIKYTPLTPSTGYGDIAGAQQSFTYELDYVYSTQETAFNSSGLQWTAVLPALAAGAKYRLDALICKLATENSAAVAYAQVTIQSATKYPTEVVIIGPWSSSTVISTYTQKSALFNTQLFGIGEAVTLRWYIRTSNATYHAYIKEMTYKYTPMTTQAAPNPNTTGTTTVSIYNTADSLNVLDLCNNLLPNCKMAFLSDYAGTFEYTENFNDDTYKNVIVGSGGLTYSSTDKTLTVATSTGWVAYKFDIKYPITGIPFIQMFIISGCPKISYSIDNITYYDCDDNTTIDLVNTPIYRELNNAAGSQMDGETVYYIKITANTASAGVIGSIYHYADLLIIDAARPKIFATGEPNTFEALLSGNPVDITIRSRDANRAG